MKTIKILMLLICAVCFTSCATGPSIDYQGISSKIQSGEIGGVIGSYKASGSKIEGFGAQLLNSATLKVTNVDDGTTAYVTFSKSPLLRSFKPGNYKVTSGSVRGPNVKGNMPMISFWADEFAVKAGEVVNLGELSMNRIASNVKTGGAWKVVNAISSFGTDVNDEITYVTYEVNPMTPKVQSKALEKFSGVEDRLVYRPLGMKLSETEFRKIIEEAGARDADGNLPSEKEVKRKMTISMLKMFMDSKALKKNLPSTK